jgi:hypothetical protein
MRRNGTALILACALVSSLGVGIGLAKEGKDAEITVHGEILDMACYVSNEAKGPDHAACAKRCAKGGQPMGLLADNGKVYLLFADHSNAEAFEQAKDLAGTKVEILGKAVAQAGINGLEVHKVSSH